MSVATDQIIPRDELGGVSREEADRLLKQGAAVEFFASPQAPNVLSDVFSLKKSLHSQLFKVADTQSISGSNRTAPTHGSGSGRLEHPFHMELANRCLELSPYHGACQATLVSATLGGGLVVTKEEDFEGQEIDVEATYRLKKKLNSLSDHTGRAELKKIVQGFWSTGQGYLEVQRDGDEEIEGITATPPTNVHRHQLGEDLRDYCFAYEPFNSYGLYSGQSTTYFSKWRCKEAVRELAGKGVAVNEMVDFTQVTSRWEGYGAPHWFAAVPYIELEARSVQRVSDYLHNNGKPDSILVIMGAQLGKEGAAQVQQMMVGAQGRNIGRNGVLIVPQAIKDRAEIKLIQTGNDIDGVGHEHLEQTYNLKVASANKVPPILAGISTPGKLGSSNEQVLAMVVMQCDVIDDAQEYIAERLNQTLFSTVGGIRGFAGRNVRFKKWSESVDIKALNTTARMQESAAEKTDRDPSKGLKR